MPPSSPMVILFFTCYRLFVVVFSLVGGSLGLTLFLVAQSESGTLFAIGAMLLSQAPLLDWIARDRHSRFLSLVSALALAGWVGITIWLFVQAPDGRASDPATARVQNRYVFGEWDYPRSTLGNLLPELDQFLLGFKVVPVLDPLLTHRQTAALARDTTAIYQELDADPEFHALGSVMPHAYDDLLGGRTDHGHSFLYIPKNLDRKKPAPALIFLHGSGGNFKAYTWLLAKIADARGAILLAPTFGIGNWEEPRTTKLIQAALRDAAKIVPIDPNQKHLIGLSNGGIALCQIGAEIGEQFTSLTFISPVMDLEPMNSQKFARRWKGRPILVLTGQADDRVHFDYVTSAVSQMKSRGAQVTFDPIPAADHFLLFSHRDLVLQKMATWLQTLPAVPPPIIKPNN